MPAKTYRNSKSVKILWKDAKFYHFFRNKKESLTLTMCQGEIIKNTKDFIILRNSRQFVFSERKKKFVLKRKANFFFIPIGMIEKIK